MDEYAVEYDESKSFETIFDFHNAQIFRVNSTNTDLFLSTGKEFDLECEKRVDEQGRIRIIYVCDQIPPLTSILQFISNPFTKVKWGVYAVIVPQDKATLDKITPIITYGLGLTGLKNKFSLKVFDNTHRNNLKEVIDWMDLNMDVQTEAKIDIKRITAPTS